MRIRTVKPEFWSHETLWDAEQVEKLPLRLTFIGLWCVADREGRFRWEPRRLRSSIHPYCNKDFEQILFALERHGFIVRYGEQMEYAFIPSFHRHQCVNAREAQSQIPEPPCSAHARICTHVHARGEGKGREMEGKGREGRSGTSSKSPEPPRTNLVDDRFITEMKKLYVPGDVDKAVAKCKGWLMTPNGRGKAFSQRRLLHFLRDAEPNAQQETQPELQPIQNEPLDLQKLEAYVADQWPQHAGKPADQLPRQVIEDFKALAK